MSGREGAGGPAGSRVRLQTGQEQGAAPALAEGLSSVTVVIELVVRIQGDETVPRVAQRVEDLGGGVCPYLQEELRSEAGTSLPLPSLQLTLHPQPTLASRIFSHCGVR